MLQSTYRKFHSTESALLKVKNDILLNMNSQHVTLLVLLDLSAAFDTIDYGILLEKLRSAFGVRDTALSWIASYLSGRTQQVSIDGTLSMKFDLECGVPQGSCLGPLLFVVYASKRSSAMLTRPNVIYPSVLIILQIKRLPWLGLKGVLRIFVTGCWTTNWNLTKIKNRQFLDTKLNS